MTTDPQPTPKMSEAEMDAIIVDSPKVKAFLESLAAPEPSEPALAAANRFKAARENAQRILAEAEQRRADAIASDPDSTTPTPSLPELGATTPERKPCNCGNRTVQVGVLRQTDYTGHHTTVVGEECDQWNATRPAPSSAAPTGEEWMRAAVEELGDAVCLDMTERATLLAILQRHHQPSAEVAGLKFIISDLATEFNQREERLKFELAQLREALAGLQDPVAVYANMLRGTIACPKTPEADRLERERDQLRETVREVSVEYQEASLLWAKRESEMTVELEALRADARRLRASLGICAFEAEAIENTRWGYDGDCGAVSCANTIAETCREALAARKES